MKKILTVILLVNVFLNFGQNIKFNNKEYFTLSTSIDPSSSIKEKGLDILAEIEYVGLIYTKFGFESFSVLKGGYTDIHGALGINLTSGYFEKIRYYGGFRSSMIFRNRSYAWNPGLELGFDYQLSDNFFIGLRSTLDRRNDQKIQDYSLKPENQISGFIRLGYRWDYNPRYTYKRP